MNFRRPERQLKSTSDLQSLEETLANLPRQEPRAGLKQELLTRVLAEARRQDETVVRKRQLRLAIPNLRLTATLAGAALSVAFVLILLPDSPESAPTAERSISGISASQQIAQELAMKKGDNEDRLMRQTIPHQNGQFIGEGVEIMLNDKQSLLVRKGATQSEIESNYDLLRLVQEIYTSGGQVVAINGILVKPYTEIVTRGALTEVSERRIQSPFTIKVIGDSDKLFKKLSQNTSTLMSLKQEKEMDVEVQRTHLVSIAMK